MSELWGFVSPRYLIRATRGFIVWIDDELDVDWKTKPDWADQCTEEWRQHSEILNRATALESGVAWDDSDRKKTLYLKRQIGESIARYLDRDFVQAEQMLDRAQEYLAKMQKISSRQQAIKQQIQINNEWRGRHKRWIFVHYVIGCAALLFSTLLAAKPLAFGFTDSIASLVAWLVAFLTGLLTFLMPDKKADKYGRAWSILNSQITRYNADEKYTVNDVLDAYHRGEAIIFESAMSAQARTESPSG